MKSHPLFHALPLLWLLPLQAQLPPGFDSLFNGTNFAGWTRVGDSAANWQVSGGSMIVSQTVSGSGWMQTVRPYSNFVFTCEWKVSAGGNSGVFLRVPSTPGVVPVYDAMEIQISDDLNYSLFYNKDGYVIGDPRELSGSIYGIVGARTNVFRGVNQWNRYVLTCLGTRITVDYNDVLVVDIDARDHRSPFRIWNDVRKSLHDRPRTGFIGLQAHKGSTTWFRNIGVRELPLPGTLSLAREPKSLQLDWLTFGTERYLVQGAEKPGSSSWSNLFAIPIEAETWTVPIDPNQPARFFRIVAP